MKKQTKNRVFISKITNPKTGVYMFWYQVHSQKRVIVKGSKTYAEGERRGVIEKYKTENIKLGS